MTAYELYLQRVNSSFEAIRKNNDGFDYTPSQFGGLFGQQVVVTTGTVLEVTDFEVE